MKIYTSRYSNKELAQHPELVKIGITAGSPRFSLAYDLAGNVMMLAPTYEMRQIHDRDEFTPLYCDRIGRLGVAKIRRVLESLADGEDVVLLCFEDLRDGSKWCHRRVFAEWWEAQTGTKVEEIVEATAPTKRSPQLTLL